MAIKTDSTGNSKAIVLYQRPQEVFYGELDRRMTAVVNESLRRERYLHGTIYSSSLRRTQMDNYLQRLAQEEGFRGIVLFKVKGNRFFAKAYGIKNPEGDLNREDTRFCLGSMTKMFTGVAIMRLLQEGKIESLDDPIYKYLSSKYHHKLFDSITVRHLLTHTSGLQSYGVFPQDNTREKLYFTEEELYKLSLLNLFIEKHKITPDQFEDDISKYLPAELKEEYRGIKVIEVIVHELNRSDKASDQRYQKINRLYHYIIDHLEELEVGLLFRPGTDQGYSNSGYFLLGQIIKEVSGFSSYEEYMQREIFDRLGMDRTGFADSYDRDVDARGFHRDDREDPFRVINNTRVYSSKSNAAGGAFSTIADLERFDRALYEDQFLSPILREEMFTPHEANPTYGLGFCIDKTTEIAGHTGCNPGFNSYMMRDVKNQNLYLVLGNTSLEVFNSLQIAKKLQLMIFS